MALRELLIGVEGLALLRGLYDATDEDARRRLDEIRRLLADDTFRAAEPTSETDARTGYGMWAASYDDRDNPIIALEESIVWNLIGDTPATAARAPAPALVLDAACGTGRHARHLADLGHDVVGVDQSAAMLQRARARVPEATFIEADLRAIPSADDRFGLVVCGLALAHLPDLQPAVAELSRVLRPGGRLIVSVLHPFQALLGWQAPFTTGGGRRAFVREYPHTHAEYFAVFTASGLEVRACIEPRLSEDLLKAKRRAFSHIREATIAAYEGLPAVLVWDLEARS